MKIIHKLKKINMKYKGLRLRTWILVKLLGIKITFKDDMIKRGGWDIGKSIFLRTDAGDMACLHEIGHVLNDYDCCREHDEWRAHGFAFAFAKILKIPNVEIEEMNEAMDNYIEMHLYCPRIDRKKNVLPCTS